ncbi:MAG: MGMT family protein [Bacteroidetes bacterium]|nr:MGMT family protein [Bacteroidota bacterium]
MRQKKVTTEEVFVKKDINFFEEVWAVVRLIPKGRVTSYGAIAKYLGAANSSRMVGWAMNAAHGVKPKVPAQRVVNRNGLLTGKHHFGAPDIMQKLLEKEGVIVENDKVVNFKQLFWDPFEELKL